MTIRLFERTLANVRPDLRGLYVADREHGFRLDCDLDKIVHGLKSALATERQTVRAQRLWIGELRQQSEITSLGGE